MPSEVQEMTASSSTAWWGECAAARLGRPSMFGEPDTEDAEELRWVGDSPKTAS